MILRPGGRAHQKCAAWALQCAAPGEPDGSRPPRAFGGRATDGEAEQGRSDQGFSLANFSTRNSRSRVFISSGMAGSAAAVAARSRVFVYVSR